jgi:hypothetical protein
MWSSLMAHLAPAAAAEAQAAAGGVVAEALQVDDEDLPPSATPHQR